MSRAMSSSRRRRATRELRAEGQRIMAERMSPEDRLRRMHRIQSRPHLGLRDQAVAIAAREDYVAKAKIMVGPEDPSFFRRERESVFCRCGRGWTLDEERDLMASHEAYDAWRCPRCGSEPKGLLLSWRCIEHEDCKEDPQLGRACWEGRGGHEGAVVPVDWTLRGGPPGPVGLFGRKP